MYNYEFSYVSFFDTCILLERAEINMLFVYYMLINELFDSCVMLERAERKMLFVKYFLLNELLLIANLSKMCFTNLSSCPPWLTQICLFTCTILFVYLYLWQVRCLGRNEQRGGVWPVRHHSHLKELEFEGFQGTRYEVEFASYLLRSASALERLLICPSYSTYSADFKRTKHVGRLMDDEERQLIYKELLGQSISSKVKVVML